MHWGTIWLRFKDSTLTLLLISVLMMNWESESPKLPIQVTSCPSLARTLLVFAAFPPTLVIFSLARVSSFSSVESGRLRANYEMLNMFKKKKKKKRKKDYICSTREMVTNVNKVNTSNSNNRNSHFFLILYQFWLFINCNGFFLLFFVWFEGISNVKLLYI